MCFAAGTRTELALPSKRRSGGRGARSEWLEAGDHPRGGGVQDVHHCRNHAECAHSPVNLLAHFHGVKCCLCESALPHSKLRALLLCGAPKISLLHGVEVQSVACSTWLTAELGPAAVAKHMVAVSTNLKLVKEFGIDPENAFAFWDWVGGRYSVCSAVGVLPLSLQYGFEITEKFLQGVVLGCWRHSYICKATQGFLMAASFNTMADPFQGSAMGSTMFQLSLFWHVLLDVHHGCVKLSDLGLHKTGAHDVDEHFRTAPFEDNIPVLLGMMGVWNTTFLGYPSLAILPYTQALSKLAPHIQQVSTCM